MKIGVVMKVVDVEDFAIIDLKKRETCVFLIEGYNTNVILIYSFKNKEFMLFPVGDDKKMPFLELENKVSSRVSLINKLAIKLDRCSVYRQFQLGKVRFYKTFFLENENLFYYEQAKKALLKVNDRHPDNIKAYLEGYAEFDDDIFTFVDNLKAIKLSGMKEELKKYSQEDCDVSYLPIQGKIKNLNPLNDIPEEGVYID